jgi:acetyltransferase
MYAGSIEALYECNEVDIIIPVLLQRSALMRENVEAVRDAVLRCQRERGLAKPTYVCWVVGREGDENQVILQEAGIPVYEWPERTARTAAAIAAYAEDHRTRTAAANVILSVAKDLRARSAAANVILSAAKDLVPPPAAREQAASILTRARTQNRTSLLESEVKALLAAYGARIPRETLCTSSAEALAAGQILGKPCVLKIVSPDISHKSDSGGVRVGVLPEEVGTVFEEMLAEVRTRQPTAQILGVSVQELVHGQEVIIGGLRDSEFGAMLMFGLGGVFVETLRDVAYRLVPASVNELRAMIHEVRGYPLLTGIRGHAAANLEKLIELLQVTAHLLEAFPEIVELDLNPVFAGPEDAVVADGRAVLAERRKTLWQMK